MLDMLEKGHVSLHNNAVTRQQYNFDRFPACIENISKML